MLSPLCVTYSCKPANSVIWEKCCGGWQAMFSTSVWKSRQFPILWASAHSITSLFQTLHSQEVTLCPFSAPLPSLSIEKLNDRHTSDWQASGKIALGKTAGWMLSACSAFCSVLVVLVISLTVDLVEIAGCSLEPQWSGSQQTASHPLKAGSQWTLH